MAALDKLIKKVLDKHKGLRFEELAKLLVHMGYTMNNPRSGSSHYTFRKAGHPPITIPKEFPINKVYVNKIRAVIIENMEDD